MSEVIYPSKTIRTFAFEIMHDNAFWLTSKTLREAMGITRKSSNWLDPLNKILHRQSSKYIAHEDNEDNILIFKLANTEAEYKNTAQKNQTGIERVIAFVTDTGQTKQSNFYISNATLRMIYNHGNITTRVTSALDTALLAVGYRMISCYTGNAVRGTDKTHYVCKIGNHSPFSFLSMEQAIEEHKLKKKISLMSPKRLPDNSMSTKNINWDELRLHNRRHNAINLIHTSHHLPRLELNLTNENSWVIESQSIESINSINNSEHSDIIRTEEIDKALSKLNSSDHIPRHGLNSQQLSTYIPFHHGNIDDGLEKINWGIYINLPVLFSSHMNFIQNTSSDHIEELPPLKRNDEIHKSLYFNLYALFQLNYFRYQVETLSLWFEHIVSATGNNTALYKEYYNKLINTRESPNIEDLASIYYCLRSFQYFKDENEKNDAFLYKNMLKKLNSDLLFLTFNNDDANDDMNTDEKMSLIKSTLAKFVLGFDIDNDQQLAAISRYVLNGHISSLRKKEIPVYISGSEQDVEQFKKLFPSAINSITNLKYPKLIEKESDDIIIHATIREL